MSLINRSTFSEASMRNYVWMIVLTYATVSSLWIFFSDRFVGMLSMSTEKMVAWSTFKGLLFVLITASMLYGLISRLTTQLFRASASWKTSERKFRTLFEEVTDGIAVVDLANRRFNLANQSFCKMLGYSEEQLRQLTVADIHPQEALPQVMESFAKQAQGLVTLVTDTPVKRADGSVFFADINATGIELENERYVIGVFRDITRHKQVESDLKAAKEAAETANRAKDQFIAVLSHELRTPLTPALATVAALLHQEDTTNSTRSDLEMVRRNLELEAKLIEDLLDVTRIARGKINLEMEPVDIHDPLRAALEICRADMLAKNQAITTSFQCKESHVLGDAPRLQQIFWNLLGNAVKFTPVGGSISIRSANSGNKIRIEIADTGVGIPAEYLPRLFRPFEQGEQTKNRRFGGLGLGLSLAKNLVELHGGRLTVASDGKDKGAVFTVELNVTRPISNTTDGPSSLAPSAQPTRILLVDDHADTLNILDRLLKRCQFDVATADSVQGALKLAAGQKFDLLISDLGLPDGSGEEIMEEVKRLYGLRGIALSGFGAEEDIQASRNAGFEEHFVKPVDFPALQSTVKRMCAK